MDGCCLSDWVLVFWSWMPGGCDFSQSRLTDEDEEKT